MTLLLLAGTADARRIAQGLAAAGVPAVATLAGAVRDPAPLAVPVHTGGFGGAEGFAAFLDGQGISRVLDATHPFAARITYRSAAICAARGLPYLRLDRPGWVPGRGDRWTSIGSEEEASRHIPSGATVFLATGPQRLDRFANLAGRRVICRRIDPPDAPFPYPGGSYIVARPPFSVAEEARLFRAEGVDVLVTRDAGGASGRAKLDAARDLRLPVLMIRRPPPPAGAAIVTTVAAALDWALAGEAATTKRCR